MYLKSIKMLGFKSFADKITLDINNGITCVVGPNGSGKSNIVDAIRWVLGESSVKQLRGNDKMSDIIFNGSKSRGPMNRASVSITFDNSDHYLHTEFNEVEIKRVMFRDLENEYYINNTKVRQKDILDLFMDTGASKSSYNIISQGTIENIVSSKPLDRRVILEEAAGVLKYKKHKEDTLKKLDKTKDNLSTIDLLISEVETTLKPLEEQSILARKYNEYKESLSNLEISLIVSDIKNINEEYQKLKLRSNEISLKVEELNTLINKKTADSGVLKLANLNLENNIDKLQNDIRVLEKELNELSSKKIVLSERRKYEVGSDTLKTNIINLKEEILKLENNLNTSKVEIETLKEKENSISNKISNIDNEELKYKNTMYSYNNELNLNNKKILEYKNKIEIINNNLLEGVGIPFSVKSILNNPRLTGVINIVSKLININDNYSIAIDASLGASSNYIVCLNTDSIKSCINYLKSGKYGKAYFLPLDIIKPKYIDTTTLDTLKNTDGFIDIASNLVKYDNTYDNIIKNLLGNTIIVKDMDSLKVISKMINYKYKVVTLEGEVSFSGGLIMGGASNKDSNNSIKLKHDLNEYSKELDKLNLTNKTLEEHINSIQGKLDNLNIERDTLNKDNIVIKETINRKNISYNELLNTLNSKKQEISDNNNILNDTTDKELDNINTKYYEINTKLEELNLKLNSLKDKYNTSKEDIEELELEIKQSNTEYNKLNNEYQNNEVLFGKWDVKLDSYLLTLNEDYSMTYEKALTLVDLSIDIDMTRLKVNKLKANIKDLGEVNLGSIAEYDRVNERYTFLNNQRNDLVNSVNELESAIKSLDNVMKDRLNDAYINVNREFGIVFNKLFRGGEAKLVLTDPDNILETGVDIVAQPPGKKLSSISLFSGGERTLTAISLLFAILNVRTLPFVILDEVEAALDDANVDVFGKYLETRKEESQYIIITHKKKTMEYADTLYGITMQEEGVSKLVSVKLTD